MTCIILTESPLLAPFSTLRKQDTEKSLAPRRIAGKPQHPAATQASWLQRQAPCHQQHSLTALEFPPTGAGQLPPPVLSRLAARSQRALLSVQLTEPSLPRCTLGAAPVSRKTGRFLAGAGTQARATAPAYLVQDVQGLLDVPNVFPSRVGLLRRKKGFSSAPGFYSGEGESDLMPSRGLGWWQGVQRSSDGTGWAGKPSPPSCWAESLGQNHP